MLKEEGINEVLKKVKETDVTAFQRYLFGDIDKPLLVANMGCSIGVSTYCAMLYEMSVNIAEVKISEFKKDKALALPPIEMQ